MTSNFPNTPDDDVSLPRVENNITEIGSEAINALRDAVFNIEEEIGTILDGYSARGSKNSIGARLGVSIEYDGTIKPSALTSLGLVTLPITNSQISASAAIAESKLNLDYSTYSLYNLISNVNTSVNTALNFITNTGSKVEPHLSGAGFKHTLSHINVGATSSFFKNKKALFRNNTNLYTLLDDINSDYVGHQKADGTVLASDVTSLSTGTVPPDNYAHVAAGININTNNFSFIPQTANDLQQFAQFIDNSNIFILGTRIQTLYNNGIPRASRSSALNTSVSGQNIILESLGTTYLLDSGSSVPVDNIDTGDDVISLTPTSGTANHTFDAKFALVKAGDIATVNYGNVSVSFIIKEKKYVVSGLNKTYIIRINGKNLLPTTSAQVSIDRPLFNTDKQGVLALGIAPLPAALPGVYPSLTVGNPRGAEVVSVAFNPDLLDGTHYNLYLQLFSTGNPSESTLSLAAVDVTGNLGTTPGSYTLDSVVESMNAAFRKPGFNYRFMAFSYKGELGLMLSDSVGGASFSIISGAVASSGAYDQTLTNTLYPNNVIGLFDGKDGLGFGPSNAAVASPAYASSYSTSDASQVPTKIFVPLTKKTYYVNGVERERLNLEPNQSIDGYGDGYWEATITAKVIVPGTRVKVTYQVNADLTTSSLKPGKTILIQKESSGTQSDFGRYVIEDMQFNSCICDGYTEYVTLTVYDAVHGTGITPYLSSNVGTKVRIYYSGDSVSFNNQNVNDVSAFTDYKRSFEILINQNGLTFSHERARMNVTGATQIVNGVSLYSSSELAFANIYRVSPKLRGYSFASVKKINLTITSYNVNSGTFSGYLCRWDGSVETSLGPVTVGKKGQVVRFYDETNIDFIDIIFNQNDAVPAINATRRIDIQLFGTLSLDDEVMLLGTCQVADSVKKITYLRDERQFGNVSEKQLTNSALDYIAAPTQLLSENGIIRGFDVVSIPSGANPYPNVVAVKGGTAVINGKIIQVNHQNIALPVVQETLYPAFTTNVNTINWFVCVNDKAELELVANTDYDSSVTTYSGLGLDHTRMFYVQNPNLTTPVPYCIKGNYLDSLINTNKDLVPIALITATISSPSGTYVITSCTSLDVRRFIGNGYAGMDNVFTLGQNANFRSMESLTTWLNQLINLNSKTTTSSLGKTVLVKGINTISSSYYLDYKSKVTFKGDNGSFNVTTGTGFNLGSNVTFEDLNINYNYDATADGAFDNAKLINFSKSCFKMTGSSTPLKNINFNNCIFASPYDKRFSFISCVLSGQSDQVENLVIKNNRFETTATSPGSLADNDAVIAIVTTNTTAPTSLTGARLTNCTIENNICNKNQMIAITAPYGATIVDAIVPVNLKIVGNTCGAINFCFKQDIPLSTVNPDVLSDKEASALISNNNCRYIYTGNSSGYINESATSNRMISKLAFYTPNITISENTVSWIHTGQRIPLNYVRENASFIVRNNKLTAYPTALLDIYWTGISGLNYAMITDKAVG
jgi:hypothetical protein